MLRVRIEGSEHGDAWLNNGSGKEEIWYHKEVGEEFDVFPVHETGSQEGNVWYMTVKKEAYIHSKDTVNV
jgi:hypothetical protein